MRKNKYFVNHDIFEIIDTSEKAYWLGYIMGDGCVSDKGLIHLASKDLEHLEKFKYFVGSNHKIGRNEFRFTSHKMKNDLAKHGILPRKTYLSLSLKTVPIELKQDTIRGLIDSDGWIYFTEKGSNIGCCSHRKEILEEINEFICQQCNFKLSKITQSKNKSAYYLNWYGTLKCGILLKFLNYKNSINLDRKLVKAKEILAQEEFILSNKTSKYKYVYKTKTGKFVANMKYNGKIKALGSYKTEEEAYQIALDFRKEHNLV